MVICISGPGSTGKTTTIHLLKTESETKGFKRVIFYPEFFYEVVKTKLNPKNETLDQVLKDPQKLVTWTFDCLHFLEKQKEAIFRDNNPDTLIILDRFAIDLAVYTLQNFMMTQVPKNIQAEIFQKIMDLDGIVDYTFLTTIPFDDHFELDDGVNRPKMAAEKEMRDLEQALFSLLFQKRAILLPLTNEERTKLIWKVIT